MTLFWMISQLEDTDGGILSFDPEYLDWLQDMNDDYYVKQKEPIKPWAWGTIYDPTSKKTLVGLVEGIGKDNGLFDSILPHLSPFPF